MIKKLLFIFTSGSLLFFGWQIHENKIVQIKAPFLQNSVQSIQMPWKDKKKLTYLFYEMIVLDSGCYTLFGNKPMYMGGSIKPFIFSDWHRFRMSISLHNIKMRQGWKIWKKYEHLFLNAPFIWRKEINPFWIGSYNSTLFVLINRNAFNEIVLVHRKDFEDVLQKENITGESLLREAQDGSLFKTVLKSHDGLIGILFGFGRNNAWLFEEKKNGKHVCLAPLWDEKIYDFLQNRPCKMCLEDLSLVFGYPTFLAEPNTPETEILKKEFINARNKILDYYKDKDFLEATFRLLLEGPIQ
jgi:hypothetical protein